MEQRGRKSAASLAVVDRRDVLPVPSGLTPAERVVWARSVNGKPSDYFRSEHVATLVDYCRTVCRLDIIDQQLREFQPEWLATEDGLKRYEKLANLGARLSGAAHTLARAMRLTHQAVDRVDKAQQKPAGRIWQREPEQQKSA